MTKPADSTTADKASLPIARIDVVEAGHDARPDRAPCEIGKNLCIDTHGLASYCLANWDARVYDAFILAGAVQFCDLMKARPKTGWGREFALRVPVHDPNTWNAPNALHALHDVLGFLTGDRWSIEFVPRKHDVEQPGQTELGLPHPSSMVMPYSDGLDSRAVAGLLENKMGKNLIRVRLGSERLGGGHNRDAKQPFALVPYSVKLGNHRRAESSARSRGFEFAILSAVAAYLAGVRQIIVPESGQGALGPTLVGVGQAYDDFRNHPLFTEKFERLFLALFEHEVHFEYPRLWNTKAETIAEYIEASGDTNLWAGTRSCWRDNRHVSVNRKKRQCGICAACMLRRLSVHAAGGSEHPSTYVWEDLTAPVFASGAASGFDIGKPLGAHYQYAIAGVLHLDHLARLQVSEANRRSLSRKVAQLSRVLGQPETEVAQNLSSMLLKHEAEWDAFLDHLGPSSFVSKWVMRGE